MNASLSRYLLLFSVVAYVACLPMVAFCVRGDRCFGSWNALIYGWKALPLHRTHLIWLANPILLVAWLLIATALRRETTARTVAALLVSSLALLVAANFLPPVGIVDNEGGVAVGVTSRAAGYWLWLVSMVAAFAATVLLPTQASSPKSS
jgi:hypothetical protein